MKLTFIKINKKNKLHLKLHTVDDLLQAVRGNDYRDTVDRLRRFCQYALDVSTFPYMYRLPVICPSAELKADADGNLTMLRFNGLITLTVGPLRDEDEAKEVKRMAATLPMTVMALVGSSGTTVKIVTAISRHNGSLPQTEAEAEQLLQQACPLVCRLYEVVLRMATTTDTLTIDPAQRGESSPLLQAGFRMTVDPTPFYRPKATPLYVPDGFSLSLPATLTAGDDGHPEEAKTAANTVGQETRKLISLLEERYAFRMNTVMGYVEYRPKSTWHYGWQPVDERVQNGMAMEARLAGINAWDKDVSRYLKSNLVRNYNPVEEYLWNLHEKWDGTDHIGALAASVPTKNPLWDKWFRTWFLGMVAQWTGRNPQYGNSMVPLLISRQGYNKSTFCKSLLPPELQWGYNDNLVLSEKKSVLQAMSQFLLINLDEFNQISPKVQEGFLKNLVQLASVKVKRPYGRHVEDFPRLASFIATANVSDILSDPSGSRRFIGVELTGPINVGRRINYTQLYAQAIALLDQGEPYWLDEKQTRLVMQQNQQFQLRLPEVYYFYECFSLPQNETDGQWLTTTAIYARIHQVAGSALKNGNIQKFGRVLANIEELSTRRSKRGTEYFVKPRQDD